MLKSISLPAVLIDVETTGGNVAFDRVTEIGIVEIYENEIREWSTLINPGTRIPMAIQQLTGITDAMVAAAPRFEQVAKEILERIKGKLFIAHNVRFDYGFIRSWRVVPCVIFRLYKRPPFEVVESYGVFIGGMND